MQERISKLMEEYKISFSELAIKLKLSNHTLTKKVTGALDWTFSEIMILSELFHIEDPQSFFYGKT
ncbi:MAG: helix-turn-helix transcriptional regulator [Herbinix sp.]|jgi:plasmid maintenance system antidote protein VapI|nr:helix-turn-helix transcriptional regulator [Herbinix sp.]